MNNVDYFVARLIDRRRCFLGNGHFFLQENWRENHPRPLNADVVSAMRHWKRMGQQTLRSADIFKDKYSITVSTNGVTGDGLPCRMKAQVTRPSLSPFEYCSNSSRSRLAAFLIRASACTDRLWWDWDLRNLVTKSGTNRQSRLARPCERPDLSEHVRHYSA